MWNTKKSAAAVFSAMVLTLASVGNAIPAFAEESDMTTSCLLYTSPSPRDRQKSRMPSSA